MSLAGKLELCIEWDGNTVLDAKVKAVRPQAYRLLEGRVPDNAVQLTPMLYSICGKAQQAAASAAVLAAQGRRLQQNRMLERRVSCEAMQEHLWRLLLDWPERFGLQPQQQAFLRWHGELGVVAAEQRDAEGLLAELPRVLLGMPLEEWRSIDSYAGLAGWWRAGNGLLAPVFGELDRREADLEFSGNCVPCAWLPQWEAADAWKLLAGHLDHDFAARPQYDGKPMETGALAHWHRLPLLQDVLRERPARLLARLVARLVDLLDSAEALACGDDAGRVQNVPIADGSGLSVVRTARGMLMHHVRIETERVAQYLIVAPTEWNFHPQGALACGLAGLRENDEMRLVDRVRDYVLSLDPCVEYRIEIAHA